MEIPFAHGYAPKRAKTQSIRQQIFAYRSRILWLIAPNETLFGFPDQFVISHLANLLAHNRRTVSQFIPGVVGGEQPSLLFRFRQRPDGPALRTVRRHFRGAGRSPLGMGVGGIMECFRSASNPCTTDLLGRKGYEAEQGPAGPQGGFAFTTRLGTCFDRLERFLFCSAKILVGSG